MRNYQTVIQEAELMAMSPVAVADFLKTRATQSKAEACDDAIDEEVEDALLKRNEPLIDLALARYGFHMEVVSKLFHSENTNSPVRIACLTNKCVAKSLLQRFPQKLFTDTSKTIEEWITSASLEELCALFENPTLSDDFLREVLERQRAWEIITDDKLCTIICILQRNTRMRRPHGGNYMDVHAEYSHSSVFNAAWKLAETAPVNKIWARDLGWLYENLQTDAFSIKNPLELAKRWHMDPTGTEATESQAKEYKLGFIGDMERVRKGLAKLALKKDYKLLNTLLESNDLAFRAAAYAAGRLSAEQLRSSYEKDGEIAFEEAIHNLKLWQNHNTRQALHDIAWEIEIWQNHNTRQALHDIAWEIEKKDVNWDLLSAKCYQLKEEELQRKHPEWFADEEKQDNEDPASFPATKNDLSPLTELVKRQAESIQAIRQKLDDLVDHQSESVKAMHQTLGVLMNKTRWMWWLLLGALIASLSRV